MIPDEAVDDPAFSLASWFGREAPLVVEIGSGVGEATAALAATRPSYDVLALEVWSPGVADGLGRVAEAGATNVRFCSVDAVWVLEHLLGEGQVAELWTFFPDPWHKKRHHKRRLVDAPFAHLAATRLAPGALWRLATDWADYAAQMEAVLGAEPLLEGGVGAALGGAAGHEVRAQGAGRRPRDHRPRLPPGRLSPARRRSHAASSMSRPQRHSSRSTRTRSASSSSPAGSTPSSSGRSSAAQPSASTSSYARRIASNFAKETPRGRQRNRWPRRRASVAITSIGRCSGRGRRASEQAADRRE